MKFNRSVKCHFSKWITGSKSGRIKDLLSEYDAVASSAIDGIKNRIEDGASKFNVLKNYKVPETWLTARAKQVVLAETYGMVDGQIKSCKELKQPYTKPKHCKTRAVLSCNLVSINLNPDLEAFDLLVELKCFDSRRKAVKIAIPLKKNRCFEKWNTKGKLSSSVILTDKYMQFSFEADVPKKTEGSIIGLDPGATNLLTSDEGVVYGDLIKPLLQKLKRKKRNSRSWKKCKKEIKYYISKTCKELPFKETKLICIENNKDIKRNSKVKGRLTKNMRSVLDGWTSGLLDSRVEMLAEENGVSLRRVPAFHNSTTCPVCGHVEKGNRLSQEAFRCLSCDYAGKADTVGALNVLGRFSLGKYGSGFKTEFVKKHAGYYACKI